MKEYIKQEFMHGDVFKLSKFARRHYLEKNYPLVVSEILDKTRHVDWTDKFSELIYCYLNDVITQPVCQECGGGISFRQFSYGYAKYCSVHSRSFKKGKKWEEFGLTPTETKMRMRIANSKISGKTWEERYGVEKTKEMKISLSEKLSNRVFTDEWKKKISKSNQGNLKGDKNPMRNKLVVEKLKTTFVARGIKIPDSELNNFELYKRKVRELTELEFRKHYHNIKNADKRGNGFDLDHKFSIFEGFKQNIPIHLIGSIHNLEMLSIKDNRSKFVKCTTTIDKILKGINDEFDR